MERIRGACSLALAGMGGAGRDILAMAGRADIPMGFRAAQDPGLAMPDRAQAGLAAGSMAAGPRREVAEGFLATIDPRV